MHVEQTIAVISDIHSNVYALEAVLSDLEARNITKIVNLGDTLFGPVAPVDTAQLLMSRTDTVHIMGNCDRYLLQDQMKSSTFQFVKPLITEEIHSWITSFQTTWEFDELLFCHGTPFLDDVYLLEKITHEGAVDKNAVELMDELLSVPQKIIFCGHTHIQKTVWLPDGKLIVNPGSVGLPAYFEEEPFPHYMESMSPHAKYVIVKRNNRSWVIEHIMLPYDWELAAQRAEQNGRTDYAYAIRTGRAK